MTNDTIPALIARLIIASFADDIDSRIRDLDNYDPSYPDSLAAFCDELIDIPNECHYADILDILNQSTPDYSSTSELLMPLTDALESLIPQTTAADLRAAFLARFPNY